ncbi:MAG: HlyC/CorC family transporter [Lachnospiraceae bacterium]|nr:HlyC/CorC family transporter [Lachnospiraceae bacterium]
MDSDAIQLIFLVILLGLSAFFSSAETSLVTVNTIRIRSLAEEGSKRAAIVAKITDDENMSKMLSAILIGNNIVNLSASSLATSMATRHFGSAGPGIATGILTLLVLMFGEITPKSLATIHSERLALLYGRIVYALMVVLTPIIFIINTLSMGFLRIFGVDASKQNSTYTENELRTIMDVSHEEGVIESEEREMINNVFDFRDSLAKDIMTPRADMTFINIESTYYELMELYQIDKYTRLPVYEESTDNVVGIVNMKDLLLLDRTAEFHIRDVMREANFTYEYKKTSELLLEMKEKSFSMVIVLDEYGITAGLITLEDLLEEIVGDIRDEFDENEKNAIRKINDREYLVEGSLKLDDLDDELHLGLESEDYDSIGGIIIALLEEIPQEGDKVETENHITLLVEKMDNKRIDTVHIFLPESMEVADGTEE